MKDIIKIISYFLIILICLSLVSCELQEVKLVDNPVCELPCWKGIEMNMSVDEVKSKLKDMPEIQYSSMMTYENPQRELDTTIVAYFLRQSFERVHFNFSNDQLKRMVFREPKGITKDLGYWVTNLAEPSSVILYGGRSNHGLLMFSSYFEEFPVCLNSEYTKQDKFFDITELTEIIAVTVFEQEFEKGSSSTSCHSFDRQEYEQDWIGYGTYRIYP